MVLFRIWIKETEKDVLPVGSELTGDTQDVHLPLHLQLPTAYRQGDEAACPTNPSAAKQSIMGNGVLSAELYTNRVRLLCCSTLLYQVPKEGIFTAVL